MSDARGGHAASIYLATPCYGGLANVNYVHSLLALQRACDRRGVGLEVALHGSDALITRARSILATQFLEAADHTHLLFVDADIGFSPEQIFRLLESGRDLVGGVYPLKRINWERVRRAAAAGAPDLQAVSTDFVISTLPPSEKGRLEDGFMQVSAVGTGLMMISRRVLETIRNANPQLRARFPEAEARIAEAVLYFETMIEPDSGRYLSEDFAFCRRWRDCGGEVWADLTGRLSHMGPAIYTGTAASLLRPG
jgi:hypothetical protein